MYHFFLGRGLDVLASHIHLTEEIDGLGRCRLLREFVPFTGALQQVAVGDARQSPKELHARLAAGKTLVLTGPYPYIDGVYRYCQRHERTLVQAEDFGSIAHPGQRRAALAKARRRRLHHLLVAVRGEGLVKVGDPPDTSGLLEWLQEPPGNEIYLVPVRRLQRILTDIERARNGIYIEALGQAITILPHVYVPADQSVPAMFAERGELLRGQRVLDMGTGTGILALLAAQLGASQVVATDFNPNAVRNVRLNAQLLGLAEQVEVKGPGDLFAPVRGRRFDRILFNAPWIKGHPQSLYDIGLYDPDYRVLDGFCKGALQHLAPGGAVLLQYSDISRREGEDSLAHLENLLAGNGLEVKASWSMERVSRVNGMPARVFLYEIRRG